MVAPRVTVIAASLNEAVQVDDWLAGLAWADRIVVVDTGSRDGTQERLRAGGAEVIDWEPPGGLIHAAKNRALEEVQDGWVLDLDLDERVPLPLRDEILAIASSETTGAETPVAYRIPFRHYVFGRWLRHGGWRGAHLRLSRASCLSYPVDRAHSTPEVAGSIGELKQFVCHFAHSSIHEFWTKMNRYTSHDAPLFSREGRGGLRNRPALAPSRWKWMRAAASVFWNRYIKATGFRDGTPGFVVAVLVSAYIFVEQAKAWELTIEESPDV